MSSRASFQADIGAVFETKKAFELPPRRLPAAWVIALMLITSGCLACLATVAMLLYSQWNRRAVVFAKWTGLGVGQFELEFPNGTTRFSTSSVPYILLKFD